MITFRAEPVLSIPQLPPQPFFAETLWEKDELEPSDTSLQKQPIEQEQRLINAVQHVNEYDFITNATYRDLTGVSDRTAHRDLETFGRTRKAQGHWSEASAAL